MKGLETLKLLVDFIKEFELGNADKLYVSGSYDIIEKELKAYEELKKVLDILKSKIKFEVNDKSLFGFNQNNLVVNKDIFGSVSLTPEEYDLLKGWLNNE